MERWTRTEATPPLGRGQVHVWRVAAAPGQGIASGAGLSPAEVERMARYASPERRATFAASHVARALLGAYLGRPAVDLVFAEGPAGKPELGGADASRGLHFNLAHADGSSRRGRESLGLVGAARPGA